MTRDELEEMIENEGRNIYSFCLHLTGNVEQGEELYQETFLQAVKKCSRLDSSKNSKSYLCGIAVRIWKNEVRKRAWRTRIAPEVQNMEEEVLIGSIADQGEQKDGLSEVLNQELVREVRACVYRLDDKYRVPVLLYYMEELPVTEIAAILKIPKGTVLSRLSTARKQLKSELEVYYYENG